ncbi:tyrosine-type recombinase/integrase [Paenibacillus sp. IHBB 3054]|uniref:tyrosine-type recombinase/integrase n=1 Tax=Paenibacillus sp. IHBB 3054 TaxID=3425689 RepID=UPI003F676EBC
MDELIEDFLTYRIASGISFKMQVLTKSYAKLFLQWLYEHHIYNKEEITQKICVEYIAYLYTRDKRSAGSGKLSKATIRKHIDFLQALGVYLISQGRQDNIAAHLVRPVLPKRLIKSLKVDQIDSLLSAVDRIRNPKTRLIYRCLFTLILDTGLRIHEALWLQEVNVNFISHYITIIGKNDKQRMVPFSEETGYLLKSLPVKDFYFCSRGSAPLSDSSVRAVMSSIKKDNPSVFSGIRLSPHTLRHTFARQWIVSGGDLYSLMQILGHSDIKMTERYLFLDEADITAKHAQHSVLNKLLKSPLIT